VFCAQHFKMAQKDRWPFFQDEGNQTVTTVRMAAACKTGSVAAKSRNGKTSEIARRASSWRPRDAQDAVRTIHLWISRDSREFRNSNDGPQAYVDIGDDGLVVFTSHLARDDY
jgi:hypothetical protein